MTTRIQEKIEELVKDAIEAGNSPRDVVEYMQRIWGDTIMNMRDEHNTEWLRLLK